MKLCVLLWCVGGVWGDDCCVASRGEAIVVRVGDVGVLSVRFFRVRGDDVWGLVGWCGDVYVFDNMCIVGVGVIDVWMMCVMMIFYVENVGVDEIWISVYARLIFSFGGFGVVFGEVFFD